MALLPLLLALAVTASLQGSEHSSVTPTSRQILDLPLVRWPRISPDGEAVVYTMRSTDWQENRYDTEIWMARRGEKPFQLTQTEGGSSNYPLWSPDGKWISFWADRGDGMQIWLISPEGGEARLLTAIEGLEDSEWAPDSRRMAVSIVERESEERNKQRQIYGSFEVVEGESLRSHLWVLDVERALANGPARLPKVEADSSGEGDRSGARADPPSAFRRLTGGSAFTMGEFEWSPDGTRLAIDHKPDPRDPSTGYDLSLLDVESGEIRSLVVQPGLDGSPVWSPDGKWILFFTTNGNVNQYMNRELATISPEGGRWRVLTSEFDENPNPYSSLTHRWLPAGVRFIGRRGTHRQIFHIDPDSGEASSFVNEPGWISEVDYTPDGREMVFIAEGANTLSELYRCSGACKDAERITAVTELTAGWPLGRREVIEWTSHDGTQIEGVLCKPETMEPGRRYPLLVAVHGGPILTSYPRLVYSSVHPVEQWVAGGALVLMPNYRGSAGYGEAFRRLNVGNVGVPYVWDILSGVDHLIDSGLADPELLGIMGWSHGGYITGFVISQTDRFRAASVGAGYGDWGMVYAATDLPVVTTDLLGATPWEDPEIYTQSSTTSYLHNIKTPTLIQHGDRDTRVGTVNSHQLFRAFKDLGVETKLVLYNGLGHSINRPKERLAARWHNWQWFAKHMWGETVELPLEEPDVPASAPDE